MTKSVLMVASAASLAFALGAGTAAAAPQENPCGAGNPCANPCSPAGENPCATPPVEGDVEGDMPAEGGDAGHGLTLPVGKLSVGVTIAANLGKDAVFKPVSVSPDLWYGVADNLTIGLAHSAYGTTGFLGGAGASLCLTGEDNGCGKIYSNGLIEGRYQFLNDGSMMIAGQVGIGTRALDPDLLLLAKVGVMARFMAGTSLMIDVNPNVFIGITERDGGNKEFLNLPISLSIMAAPNVGLMLQTGVAAPFDGFGDFYSVPVAVGGVFWVTPMIGLAASFTAGGVLTGIENDDAFDQRQAAVSFLWHN